MTTAHRPAAGWNQPKHPSKNTGSNDSSRQRRPKHPAQEFVLAAASAQLASIGRN
jgi:hypothetical protein